VWLVLPLAQASTLTTYLLLLLVDPGGEQPKARRQNALADSNGVISFAPSVSQLSVRRPRSNVSASQLLIQFRFFSGSSSAATIALASLPQVTASAYTLDSCEL
jgi:hypothetical protein